MSDLVIFESVLGFDLKADIKDLHGNLIKSGVKNSVMPEEFPSTVSARITDRNFFTHFNDDLLKRIREYRRLND